MDPTTSRYGDPDDLPAASDHPFLTDNIGGYNPVYTSNQAPAFGSHWDLNSFQDASPQSTLFPSGAEPTWQPSNLPPSNPPPFQDYRVQPGSYGLPYAGSPAPYEFGGFNQQHAQPFSTASYDPSLAYGQGQPLNPRALESPAIADFARPSTQHATISPQALQTYPNPYGGSVGLPTDYQVSFAVHSQCALGPQLTPP